MEKDFNGYIPPYMDFNTQPPFNGSDIEDLYKDPMFNPIIQNEQACSYYRYLCMKMDYKIKCKEYEKMCAKTNEKTNKNIE